MWKASKISMDGWWMVTITVRLERATFCSGAAWRGHVQAGGTVGSVRQHHGAVGARHVVQGGSGHVSVGCHQAGGISDNTRQC